MSRNQRSLMLGLAVVVIVIGFFVARSATGGDDGGAVTTTETAAKTPVVTVRDDQPVGGIQKLEFAKGGTIDFEVHSVNVDDEIHFHGYDIGKDVKPGGTVHFHVPATADGRYEVELERKGVQIAEVEVTP